MAFWGPSDTQKEAQAFPRTKGAWDFQQYQDWLARQQGFGAKADWLRDWAVQYYLDRSEQGFPVPEEIRALAERVMPGIEDIVARRQGRLEGVKQRFGELPTAEDTMAPIREGLDTRGRRIGETYEDLQGEIRDVYGRSAGREEGAHGAVVGDITGRYGALGKQAEDVYGGLRKTGAELFQDLQAGSTGAFGEARKSLEMLRPGGELQAAQVARSYAPVIAGAAGRIRRAGVDPASAQAANLMTQAEVARARGMDEAAAASTTGFVDRSTAMRLAEQDAQERLRRAGFGAESDLSREGLGITRDLSREQGGLYRGEVRQNVAAQTALDEARSQQTLQNLIRSQGQEFELMDARDRAALLARGMGREDWATGAGLERELNEEELTALGLRNTAYDRGLRQAGLDLDERSKAAAQLLGLSDEQYRMLLASASTARGFGNDASTNYKQAWQYEAPNAGWGKKLIGSLAGAALSAIPVVGPIVGPMAGAAISGWGGRNASGEGGGGSTNPFAGLFGGKVGNIPGGFRGISDISEILGPPRSYGPSTRVPGFESVGAPVTGRQSAGAPRQELVAQPDRTALAATGSAPLRRRDRLETFGYAEGGIIDRPMRLVDRGGRLRSIGERGPEAVIPLQPDTPEAQERAAGLTQVAADSLYGGAPPAPGFDPRAVVFGLPPEDPRAAARAAPGAIPGALTAEPAGLAPGFGPPPGFESSGFGRVPATVGRPNLPTGPSYMTPGGGSPGAAQLQPPPVVAAYPRQQLQPAPAAGDWRVAPGSWGAQAGAGGEPPVVQPAPTIVGARRGTWDAWGAPNAWRSPSATQRFGRTSEYTGIPQTLGNLWRQRRPQWGGGWNAGGPTRRVAA